MKRSRLGLLLFIVVLIGAGIVVATVRADRQRQSEEDVAALTSARSRVASKEDAGSNILPEDYVGPQACAECHSDRFEQWSQHPHSKMNQNPSALAVMGDFENAHLVQPGGDVHFDHRRSNSPDDIYTMTLVRNAKTVRSYRVTRTVGSRMMQFYIGKQVEGPEPPSDPIYNVEHKLPYAYWFKLKRWVPESYFDPVGPDVGPDGVPLKDPFDRPIVLHYEKSCFLCHNTYAYVYRLGLDPQRLGFAATDLSYVTSDMRTLIARTLDLSNEPPDRLQTIGKIRPDRDLVTLGISCEACHFGGRDHVRNKAPLAWRPVHPGLSITPPTPPTKSPWTPESAYAINNVCRQCHSAVASTYANGAGVSNSREALDMAAGACAAEIRCTSCHDPHKATGAEAQPPAEHHLAACTQCHSKYAEPNAASAHTKHPAARGEKSKTNTTTSASVSCLDCHMPRISQGLDEAVRSHRISSPTDPRMLDPEQPNACNLCHLDKSLSWTEAALVKNWGWAGRPKSSITSDQPVGRVWLKAKSPFVRLVATQAWARSPLGSSVKDELLDALDDPMAVDRVFASFAVGRVLGAPLTLGQYDPTAGQDVRRRQIAELKAHK